VRAAGWIASRSLSSGVHSRDPLARNDGALAHACGRDCDGNGGGGRKGGLGSRQAPAERPAIIQ